MALLDTTMLEFGQSMGFSDLKFSENGIIQLQLEHLGDLYMERLDDNGVLVYVAQTMEHPELKHYRQALELCHPREEHEMSVNPGLFNDNGFIYSIRLDQEDCTVPNLNQGLDLLKKMHERGRI